MENKREIEKHGRKEVEEDHIQNDWMLLTVI
jgi:hypothetical protein